MCLPSPNRGYDDNTYSCLTFPNLTGIIILIHLSKKQCTVFGCLVMRLNDGPGAQNLRNTEELVATNQVTAYNAFFGDIFSKQIPDWLRLTLRCFVSFVLPGPP